MSCSKLPSGLHEGEREGTLWGGTGVAGKARSGKHRGPTDTLGLEPAHEGAAPSPADLTVKLQGPRRGPPGILHCHFLVL